MLTSALVAASCAGGAAGVTTAGLLAAALGTLVLVPQLGGMGAAIASTLGCAVATGGAGWLAMRRIGIWLRAGELLRLAVATAPVVLLAHIVPSRGVWLVVELGGLGLLQLALLALCGVVRAADLRLLAGRA